jgi:hypothetical protein
MQEGAFDSAEETLKEGEVKMTIKLKTTDGFAPQSKGLSETEEGDIHDVLVFAFRLEKLSYIKEASSVDNSTQKSFTAILNASASSTSSNNYKLMILANAKTTIKKDTWGALIGKNYAEVQAALHKTVTGKMYPAASGESIIMWGETDYVNITPEFTPPAIQLLRSVARIDVGVNSSGSNWTGLSNFKLKSVSVYRSNERYALVPLVDNRTTDGGNIKVTAPTDIPSKNEIDAPLTYPVENNKLSTVREIYVSESNIKMDGAGISGDANHEERMALVIGGSYAGSEVETFYRVDFLSGEGKTLADVLRNHHYQFNITQVVGAGYKTAKEAYQARAINMSVEVVEWNDATLEDIVFDGQYYLTISQKQVKFNQFGEPSENNIITVKTNGGALAIEGFTETPTNSGIYKDPKDYFTITKTGTNNGTQSESVYTLTATAKAAAEGDLLHEAVANIKVRNINTSIDLYQELYNPFRLETNPASNTLISVDDAEQLIEVKVSSTADYKIKSDDLSIVNGCQDDKGKTYADGAAIPAATQTIYLKVKVLATLGSRVGSVVVMHADETSTANTNTLVVIQEKKYLTASLLGAPAIPIAGGEVAIQVNTNLKHWKAQVIETGGADFATISKSEGGIGTNSIMLKVAPIVSTETVNRSAKIRFTSDEDVMYTEIKITQEYIKKHINVSGPTVIAEAGETVDITVDTNLESWSAEVTQGAGYARITPTGGGSEIKTVKLTVDKMTGSEDATRNVTIRFKNADGSISQDITIPQNYTKKYLTTEGESRITSDGGAVQIQITTNLPTWSVTDNADFATLSTTGGTAGTSTISVTIAEITEYDRIPPRTATIKFNGVGLATPVEVEINQSKPFTASGFSGAPTLISVNKFGELILDAKVGDTQTPIVFFKLGSLIGLASSFEPPYDKYDDYHSVVYDPTDEGHWTFNNINAGFIEEWWDQLHIRHTQESVERGTGDICRLVGLTRKQIKAGVIDNRKWKMDFLVGSDESYTGNDWTTVNGVPGRYVRSSDKEDPYFLPAAGVYRERHDSPDINYQGMGGYYYNINPDGMSLIFDEADYNAHSYNLNIDATPIRCIRQ